jgi:1,4-alpha-glucan branching enzyme
MGGEIGDWNEWYHEKNLDWSLLDYPSHAGLQRWVKDLNRLYKNERALYELDFDPSGFEWIDCNDAQQSTLSLLRKGGSAEETIVVACNFTPVPRHNYRVGVPTGGLWQEILNSDAHEYGGSGQGNFGAVEAEDTSIYGRPYSLNITLPPIAAVYFKRERV